MRILVIGGAVSGIAAARLAKRLGHQVSVYDQNPGIATDLLAEGIGTIVGEWAVELLTGVDVVVTSPGVPERALPLTHAHELGVPVWSEVEYAWRVLEAPIAAITGTNGKTTVTELVAAMLDRSGMETVAAGNIGTALSDVADRPWDAVVVEVSSFQLRFIETFHPNVAVLLNVADDHLDWHGTVAAYADAKARIFELQTDEDVLVFDVDDPGASSLAARARSELIPVSGRNARPGGVGVRDGRLHTSTTSVAIADLQVDDPAYLVDLAAAAVAAEALGAGPAAVESVMLEFRPGLHRRTVVAEFDGIVWVDDSKATNPHAAVAAIEAYESVILIAGGRNKGLDLSPITAVSTLKHVIALGEAADELVEAARGPVTKAIDLADAIRIAASLAAGGDTVLLAPGCASFDMFTSYAARGAAFAESVQAFERSHP